MVIFSAFYGTQQCTEAHTLSVQDNVNIILPKQHISFILSHKIFMYFSSFPCLLPILTISFSFTSSSYQYLMNIKMYVISLLCSFHSFLLISLCSNSNNFLSASISGTLNPCSSQRIPEKHFINQLINFFYCENTKHF